MEKVLRDLKKLILHFLIICYFSLLKLCAAVLKNLEKSQKISIFIKNQEFNYLINYMKKEMID
jgi:hypothetical protein